MFVHYRTQGIFLIKEDRGDADQLFTVYTKDFGRLEILGKAIRKINSKLRSSADIFFVSDIEFIQGKNQKTLTDAVLIDKFENIRKDIKKLKIAYKISEILNNLVRGQELDEKIWGLLIGVFNKLNEKKESEGIIHKIYYYFLFNLIFILGYQPDPYNCSLCEKKLLPRKIYFNRKEEGFICEGCFKKIKDRVKKADIKEVKIETIKFLRLFFKKDWGILKKIKIKKEDKESLRDFSKHFLYTLSDYLEEVTRRSSY